MSDYQEYGEFFLIFLAEAVVSIKLQHTPEKERFSVSNSERALLLHGGMTYSVSCS